MGKRLEGYVDDGKGAPLPGISAIVTRLDDGGIVTSGLTGPDGRWVFTGLDDEEEYFVNLADGAGQRHRARAVVGRAARGLGARPAGHPRHGPGRACRMAAARPSAGCRSRSTPTRSTCWRGGRPVHGGCGGTDGGGGRSPLRAVIGHTVDRRPVPDRHGAAQGDLSTDRNLHVADGATIDNGLLQASGDLRLTRATSADNRQRG